MLFRALSEKPKGIGLDQMGKIKVPEGTTEVKVEGVAGNGYMLIFITHDGEKKTHCGSDMIKALNLAKKARRIIRKRQEDIL